MKKYILLAIIVCCYGTCLAQQKKVSSITTKGPIAEELYEKAFDYLLGKNGEIIDSVKAAELFEQSANMGFAKAQVERGCMEKSDSAALKWLLKAAAQNCHYAMYPLFLIYNNGRDDVPKDVQEAYKWLRKGAELGDVTCQWLMGDTYYFGKDGCPKDGKQAAYWLEKAAEQNHDNAMTLLAYMYDEGKLIKRDIQKALDLYRKAAELGNPEAAYNYAYSYQVGDGVDVDKETAFKWMKKSAELGYIKARLELAYMFATGYGCEKNNDAARYWWDLVAKDESASEQDRKGAQYNIGLLDENIEIK